jgi:hypothetical protein
VLLPPNLRTEEFQNSCRLSKSHQTSNPELDGVAACHCGLTPQCSHRHHLARDLTERSQLTGSSVRSLCAFAPPREISSVAPSVIRHSGFVIFAAVNPQFLAIYEEVAVKR